MKNYQEQVLNVIKEAVRVAGSQKQLAEAVGTNRAKICKWLTGTSPTTKDFAGIADFIGAQLIFPGETPDLRTYARMLALEAEDGPAHELECCANADAPESVLEYVAAKRHNQPDMLFHPDYLKHLKLDAADGILYRVHNNALRPTICQGDLVLADRTQISIEDGALYLLQFGPSFALRYAARELGRVILYTTSSVPSQSLTPEQEQEIKILGRVVWVGKKL